MLPDEPGKEKIEFESGFAKPTVNGQWQKCVGRCFARREGKWVQVWETQPIDLLFQPLPLVGDFDGDGKPEIAILPFHELLLLDARTGAIKHRCRFTDTRSYGFFGAYDLAHDGRTEFLVQADFSKHVDVLGFRDGKLTLLWQRNVEADISNPQKILRVGPNPVADVDGDGQSEVLTTIFNERGDQRWRVTVHEALTGRIKAELPDEYLAAVLALDGGGVSQLLTISATGAGVPEFGTIRVRSLKDNRLTTLWEKKNAAWETVGAASACQRAKHRHLRTHYRHESSRLARHDRRVPRGQRAHEQASSPSQRPDGLAAVSSRYVGYWPKAASRRAG